jgi:hypothetical protein
MLKVYEGEGNIETFETDMAIIHKSVGGVWDLLSDGSRPANNEMCEECMELLSRALVVVMRRLR